MPGKRDLLKRGVMCGLALLVVCGSATVRSQEGPRIIFEHDGKGVSGFVLYAQPEKGKEMRIDLGLPPKGTRGERSATLPALPSGKYSLSIAAYNAAGESARVQASPKAITVRDADVPAQAPLPAPVPPPTAASVPAPGEAGRNTGVMGKLWRVIVGD